MENAILFLETGRESVLRNVFARAGGRADLSLVLRDNSPPPPRKRQLTGMWQSTHHGSLPTTAVYPPWQSTHHGSLPTTAVYPPRQSTHHGSLPTTAVHPPRQSTHHGLPRRSHTSSRRGRRPARGSSLRTPWPARGVTLGLGRIVASYHPSSDLYRIHFRIRRLYF
jgi:hypothetical protein